MTAPDPRALHASMLEVWRGGRLGRGARDRALEEVARLARRLPVGDLNWGQYHDLYWNFCEDVADAVREADPDLARRLYELAEESYVKEGTQATGSGEGLASVADRERVQRKREGLPPSRG